MDKAKKKWLEEIGAIELKEPCKYIVFKNSDCNAACYSEKCINETPLEELKKRFPLGGRYG